MCVCAANASPPQISMKRVYINCRQHLPPSQLADGLPQPRSDSTLQYIAIPHKTVPTSNGCPLQQWTEGQPLPVQSIHERYNAINCMCCLKLLETPHQARHASTSTSLDKTSRAKACAAVYWICTVSLSVQFLAQHASLYLTELDVSFAKPNQRVLRCNGHRVHLLSAAQGQHTMWLKLHVKNRPNLTWPG